MRVIVFVPGIRGSRLSRDGFNVWPGPAPDMIWGYKQLEELLSEDLHTDGIVRWLGISNQYQSFIDDLKILDFNETSSPPTLYLCAYDWRKSNEDSAEVLAKTIDRAHADHGGNIEIVLVGHSMGGLVCRLYLECDKYNNRPGYFSIIRLITIGTPHLGCALACTAAMGLGRSSFLNAAQARALHRDPRYPSIYELLPPPGEPFMFAHADYGYANYDISSATTSGALKLQPYGMERLRALHDQLSVERRPPHIPYTCFAGNRQKTCTAIKINIDAKGYSNLKLEEREGSGDGAVTVPSATLPGAQNFFVPGTHATLFKNDQFRKYFAAIVEPDATVVPRANQIAIRDRVVEPNESVFVALNYFEEQTSLNGNIIIEKAIFDDAYQLLSYRQSSTIELSFRGATSDQFGFDLQAPNEPGVYKVSFNNNPAEEGSSGGDDHFFVQAKGAG